MDLGKELPRSVGVPDWSTLWDESFCGVPREEFTRYAESGRLHRLFDAMVERYSDHIAVVGTRTLSYRELQQLSWQAAERLSDFGVRVGDIVGIVSENDWGSIATVLGVLRLGGTCCLVSPRESPVEVCERLAPAERVYWVLSEGSEGWWEGYSRCLDHGDGLGLGMGELFRGGEGSAERFRALKEGEDFEGPAFLFFTSGSTGRARGVMMSHPFIVLDIVRQINDLGVCPTDRLDLLFSPSFSAFLAPTFLALCSGASCWIRAFSQGIPIDLAEWLERSRITISTMSVSLMRGVMRQFPLAPNWPSLRVLSVGGEAVFASDVELFRERTHRGAILQNAMASTETRTYAQYFIGHEGEIPSPLPIGYPVLGRRVELVDRSNRLVRTGETGRITIFAGRLADGYWLEGGSDSTTFEKLEDGVLYKSSDLGYMDSGGRLVFAGRTDSVVKVRGQKVSLVELEVALLRIPGVEQAVVESMDMLGGDPFIVAWVRAEEAQTEERLRGELVRRVSTVAMPREIRVVQEFPRTRTGKVDRLALRLEMQRWMEGRNRDVESRGGGDTILAMLSRFLGRSVENRTKVSSLGIDSLRALDLGIEVAREYGKRLTLEDIVRCETVEDLVVAIQAGLQVGLLRVIEKPREGRPHLILLTSIAGKSDEYEWLLRGLRGGGLDFDGVGVTVVEAGRLRLGMGVACEIGEFAELILESVESTIDESEGAPVVIVGYSWGGFLGYELAARLQARGRTVSHLVLIDSVLGVRWGELGWKSMLAACYRSVLNLPQWIWSDALGMGLAGWRLELIKKMRRDVWRMDNDMNAARDSLYGQQYVAAVAYCNGEFGRLEYIGNLTLLRARTQSLTKPSLGALGWEHRGRVVPRVEVVAGNHVTLLREPRVKGVVRVLGSIMGEVTHEIR